MKYDPARHHRRSIRLKGYDYAQAGAYFITIVTQGRECLFGRVIEAGALEFTPAGQMVEKWWLELRHKFPTVDLDAYVVMPNHFHGIVVIVDNVGADLGVGPEGGTHAEQGTHANRGTHAGVPLPTIVQWFKTMTTNEYIREVKQSGWPPFPGKLWQRNYYEHIIRNKPDLNRIRAYIADNPSRWATDAENPAAR